MLEKVRTGLLIRVTELALCKPLIAHKQICLLSLGEELSASQMHEGTILKGRV